MRPVADRMSLETCAKAFAALRLLNRVCLQLADHRSCAAHVGPAIGVMGFVLLVAGCVSDMRAL